MYIEQVGFENRRKKTENSSVEVPFPSIDWLSLQFSIGMLLSYAKHVGYIADITRWSWRKLCRKTPLVRTLCQCDNNFLCIMALYSAHAESFGV